jgi:hypothetical protein
VVVRVGRMKAMRPFVPGGVACAAGAENAASAASAINALSERRPVASMLLVRAMPWIIGSSFGLSVGSLGIR